MTLPAAQVSGVYNAELIAMVAHELRQPLLPIRHAAALLGNAVPDPATMRRAAEIIEREADNMNRLIGDLVDVSRMQSGALELRCKRAPLSELMERAIDSAGLLASDHGHRLSVSVPPEPIYLQMDVLRLCEALHNVIANACQYVNRHGHIHVRAQRKGARVSIVVSSKGNGMPDAQLAPAIGQFAQAGRGSRIQAGLGLYLARCFVEAHDGTVTAVGASENCGGEFTIGLPCEVSTATVPAAAGEPAAGEPAAIDRFPA
jgi:signal transduction histidine kinase